jgi:hypothetical protein
MYYCLCKDDDSSSTKNKSGSDGDNNNSSNTGEKTEKKVYQKDSDGYNIYPGYYRCCGSQYCEKDDECCCCCEQCCGGDQPVQSASNEPVACPESTGDVVDCAVEKAKDRRPGLSESGNDLVAFQTPKDGYSCDKCKATFPEDTAMFGNKEDGFDLCTPCYKAETGGMV